MVSGTYRKGLPFLNYCLRAACKEGFEERVTKGRDETKALSGRSIWGDVVSGGQADRAEKGKDRAVPSRLTSRSDRKVEGHSAPG